MYFCEILNITVDFEEDQDRSFKMITLQILILGNAGYRENLALVEVCE